MNLGEDGEKGRGEGRKDSEVRDEGGMEGKLMLRRKGGWDGKWQDRKQSTKVEGQKPHQAFGFVQLLHYFIYLKVLSM